jgi:hypothetical protein
MFSNNVHINTSMLLFDFKEVYIHPSSKLKEALLQ